MRLALQVPTQYSNFGNVFRNIQIKLVNGALKNDLKLTTDTSRSALPARIYKLKAKPRVLDADRARFANI